MGIRRACSYQVRITTPKPPSEYSAILVTVQQNGNNIINKPLSSLETDTKYVYMMLNQEETKQFYAGIPAYLQIRCFTSEYDAPGSKCWPIDVWPALNDTILGGT